MEHNSPFHTNKNPPALGTRQLGKQRPDPLADPRETGPLDADLGSPWLIELRIQGTPITVRMNVENEIVIGRSDVSAAVYPDLDLTPYGGVEKGVSRRHAAIHAEADRLLIVDLNSTNGTRVNGYRLNPGMPYRLRHGDDIEIGQIAIQVSLQVVPTHDNVFRENPQVHLQASAIPGAGQHVLIVEDDRDVADVFRIILTSTGYNAIVVHDVAAAIRAVTRRMPDAVVLDLHLPDLHGLELCRYIRRETGIRHVPIVVVSACLDGIDIKKAIDAGADVFLGKPVGVDELVRTISSLMIDSNSHLASLGR